jgi:hypothetical protein
MGGSWFWRIDRQADYGTLNDLARHRVNTERIERHWDDMLRVAGSLKLGTVNASELVRSLLKSDRPSGLTLAIAELGLGLQYGTDALFGRVGWEGQFWHNAGGTIAPRGNLALQGLSLAFGCRF